MTLFRREKISSAPLVVAFIGGSVATLALVAYAVRRLVRAKPVVAEELVDFTDPYLPLLMRKRRPRAHA